MNIDPRNPVFRYLDKAIFAVAALVALLAVFNMISGPNPAVQTVSDAEEAVDDLQSKADNKPVPEWEAPAQYNRLASRFDPSSIEGGNPFRLFVFYSPDEIVGDPITIPFRPDLAFPDRPTTTYYITRDYGKQYQDLLRVDYSKAEKPIITGDANIADIRLNVEKKGVDITPRQAGEANVRIEFAEGTSFEFSLTVVEGEKLNERIPLPPVNLTATEGPGYVNLTWQTNPQSCPAVAYKIYRSDSIDNPFEVVAELQVSGSEDPAKATTIDEVADGKVVIRKYGWDDLKGKPNHKYFYQVETTGYVVNKAGEKIIEGSNQRAEIEATPENRVSLTLVSGAQNFASFEMVVTDRFIPTFKSVMARPGEVIRSRDTDSGYTLLDVLSVPVEKEREMPVLEDGRLVNKMVKYIDFNNNKAIAVGENGQAEVFWREGRQERDYADKVRKLFNNVQPELRLPLPKMDAKSGSTVKPEITVVNNAQQPVTIGLRAGRKDNALVEIPWNMSRTFEIEEGKYEIVAEYPGIDNSGEIAYYAESISLKEGRHYDLTLDIPKTAEEVMPEGAEVEAAPENNEPLTF